MRRCSIRLLLVATTLLTATTAPASAAFLSLFVECNRRSLDFEGTSASSYAPLRIEMVNRGEAPVPFVPDGAFHTGAGGHFAFSLSRRLRVVAAVCGSHAAGDESELRLVTLTDGEASPSLLPVELGTAEETRRCTEISKQRSKNADAVFKACLKSELDRRLRQGCKDAFHAAMRRASDEAKRCVHER